MLCVQTAAYGAAELAGMQERYDALYARKQPDALQPRDAGAFDDNCPVEKQEGAAAARSVCNSRSVQVQQLLRRQSGVTGCAAGALCCLATRQTR